MSEHTKPDGDDYEGSDAVMARCVGYVPRVERVNVAYAALLPNNCPVIEETGDGVRVGTCTFYMKDGKTCPRHGKVRE